MENSTVRGTRSRSRSKTPFLRSSCDRENCSGIDDHVHSKSGRKTPIRRSTPIKQSQQGLTKVSNAIILEEEESNVSPPAHRTRQKTTEKVTKTSDYSSEESLDRLKGSRKEIIQNEVNNHFERVSTSSRGYSTLADVTLSPISQQHASRDRSRYGSPSGYSACSTDSSFAEQALADASTLLDREGSYEHLPYRLYKMAGEYWNKYPKTDYTYSKLSKDRVELAPGQIAVPNMSRRSLSTFRVQGPNTSADEVDRLYTETMRKRKVTNVYDSPYSSDEEYFAKRSNGPSIVEQRWWITRLLITLVTTITTSVSKTYRGIVGPSHRYPYTERRPQQVGLLSRSASLAAAPFYWMYTIITKIVTTAVTTISETITPNHVSEGVRRSSKSYSHQESTSKRSRWPWLLLLLLPLLGYSCYHYSDHILPQIEQREAYTSPVLPQDPDLIKRMAALEKWAMNVDPKLRSFDKIETWAMNVDNKLQSFNDKLMKLDSLDARIEQYTLKHLQQNFIQIFNNNEDSVAVAAKLKEYFDKIYTTKEQVEIISEEANERAFNARVPEFDEGRIRELIKEYLAIFERRQLEIIVDKIKETVIKTEVRTVETGFDVEAVKRIVAGMIDKYDADRTGAVDYAMESAGGQVLSTKCTELYQIKTKQYYILGLPFNWVFASPRHALTPGSMPGECWSFQGFPGYLVIRLYAIVEVTGFSIEHMSKMLAVDGKIESAPKNFSVYGLHDETDTDPHLFGSYVYDANGTSVQHFPVQNQKTVDIAGVLYPVAFDIVELRIESNHGNPTYTCVYRFRVHGNPWTDIRKVTEDNMRDAT